MGNYKPKRQISLLLSTLSFLSIFAVNLLADHHQSQIIFHAYDDKDLFQFKSKAPLETIVGTTNQIAGKIIVHPDDVTKDLQATFEIDLASIKTGIKMRDEHLRDQYLETKKFPTAMLTIENIVKVEGEERKTPQKLENGKSAYVDAEGLLKLHGVEKRITIKRVKITYLKGSKELESGYMFGDLLKIDGSFSLKLSDFEIKVPQFLVLKLSGEIQIEISMLATTVAPKKKSEKDSASIN